MSIENHSMSDIFVRQDLRRRKKNNGIGTEIGMCYDIADINRLSDGFDSRYLLSREKPMNSRKV